MAIESQTFIKKTVYLSILDLTKTEMYEFRHDFIEEKFCEKANLCYVDTDSFIVYVKTDDIYKDMQEMLKQDFTWCNER